jgi:signal transduction histidine kinase
VIAALIHRLRHPQTTVRWRLTLMYGALFLVCGAALLSVTYALLAHATVRTTANLPFRAAAIALRGPLPAGLRSAPLPGWVDPFAAGKKYFRGTPLSPGEQVPRVLQRLLKTRAGRDAIVTLGREQQIADLQNLEVQSAIALGIMAIISGALGWVVAGRVLRPLRTITATTQQISEANLHERLAIPGPRDELRTLADTIDGLLERLQAAFDAQRRFVANASHELRTPLTAAQAMLEMVMDDPNATVETFRATCAEVLEESAQQEQLIEALLALAQGQRGVDRREPVELAALVRGLATRYELDAAANGVRLDVSLHPTIAAGDRRLLERLLSNLLDNAIRHNVHGGAVRVHVDAVARHPTVSVSNTGPTVPADEIERLLQPFQRMAPGRTSRRDEGLGLGLSIVAAIAGAHDAGLQVQPRDGGGLLISVRFPPAPARPDPAPAGPPAMVPAKHRTSVG